MTLNMVKCSDPRILMNDALESETRRNCEMMSLIETEFSGGKKVSLNGSSDSQYHGLIYY